MERYLGCDVHASNCTFCVMDVPGKQIRCDVVETNGQALRSYLQQFPGKLPLRMEESARS